MSRKRLTLLCVTLFTYCLTLGAQTNGGSGGSQHFHLKYVINSPELDTTFINNTFRMSDIRQFLKQTHGDSLMTITGVDFRGTASPDGTYERNVWLSENRLRTFKAFVRKYIDIPDSLIFSQSSAIPWDEFRQAVAESNVPQKAQVLDIIDGETRLVPLANGQHIDERLIKLRNLDKGRVWEYLKSPILRDLRYGHAVIYYTQRMPALKVENGGKLALPETLALDVQMPQPLPLPEPETWTSRLYLKTNLLGLAALSANLAVEYDFAPHWSLTLPVYYCAMDYFKSTIKFRNFTIQPEVRYWPNAHEDNHGFFVGAHFGMMYYNFAIDGSTRYQDYLGRTPALGGGIGLGFRKAIAKNKRWHIEYTAGAGAYKLDYSKFHNTPDVKEGYWYGREQKTFIGLDQVAITLTYNFPLAKRERKCQKGGGQ